MRLSTVFLAAILCTALCAPSGAQAWTRVDYDSFVLATQDEWYLEEFDRYGRPESAVRWKKGEISERIYWKYDGESQHSSEKRIEGKDLVTLVEFDGAGNEMRITESRVDGTVVSLTDKTWSLTGELLTHRVTKNETVEEYVYTRDSTGTLRNSQFFRNGQLVLDVFYGEDDNRLETVYRDGKPVLTVEFVDGVKRRTTNRE